MMKDMRERRIKDMAKRGQGKIKDMARRDEGDDKEGARRDQKMVRIGQGKSEERVGGWLRKAWTCELKRQENARRVQGDFKERTMGVIRERQQ